MSKKKKISVNLHVEKNDIKYFESIYGDEKRYEQILINFVSNALKFTDTSGQVDITLEAKSITGCMKSSRLNLSDHKLE